MGAEQIGNFLPIPLPHAQTLLGACGEQERLSPVVPPKVFSPSVGGGLTPTSCSGP